MTHPGDVLAQRSHVTATVSTSSCSRDGGAGRAGGIARKDRGVALSHDLPAVRPLDPAELLDHLAVTPHVRALDDVALPEPRQRPAVGDVDVDRRFIDAE